MTCTFAPCFKQAKAQDSPITPAPNMVTSGVANVLSIRHLYPMDIDQPFDPDHHLDWRGTVPVSTQFDDPYYSFDDGVAETQHVFMGGNDLPRRFQDGFHIAETGFGTGLNFLVALKSWRDTNIGGRLFFTSFEAFPLPARVIRQAHRAFPDLMPLSDEIDWTQTQITFPDAVLTILQGDARQTLPRWDGMANA
ncbi:MAG: hypothetical protein AAF701_03420, partial [Pseudomonadota bacterium]